MPAQFLLEKVPPNSVIPQLRSSSTRDVTFATVIVAIFLVHYVFIWFSAAPMDLCCLLTSPFGPLIPSAAGSLVACMLLRNIQQHRLVKLRVSAAAVLIAFSFFSMVGGDTWLFITSTRRAIDRSGGVTVVQTWMLQQLNDTVKLKALADTPLILSQFPTAFKPITGLYHELLVSSPDLPDHYIALNTGGWDTGWGILFTDPKASLSNFNAGIIPQHIVRTVAPGVYIYAFGVLMP